VRRLTSGVGGFYADDTYEGRQVRIRCAGSRSTPAAAQSGTARGHRVIAV